MKLKRTLSFLAVFLVATAARLPAQITAAELLQRAIHLYEDVEIEDAIATLHLIVSPTPSLDVSSEQRAQAYKYLGAIFALRPGAENSDSAIANFGAAITRDPSLDLDAQTFTPTQRALFNVARDRTFAIALEPLRPDTLDSSGATMTFRCVTSHTGQLHAELRSGGATVLVLFDGPSVGPREIPWDGTLPGPTQAPEGRYEMTVIGRSALVNQIDSAAVYFDLQLDHPPLEDTLPDLGPQDLLPEVGADSAAIPANVEENQRRQAERAANNAPIAERNAEVLRRSKLVITPAASGGP